MQQKKPPNFSVQEVAKIITESLPVTSTFSTNFLAAMPALGANADSYDRKEFIKRQLDTLRGQEVLGGLVFEEGLDGRAHGGVLHACRCSSCAVSACLYRES